MKPYTDKITSKRVGCNTLISELDGVSIKSVSLFFQVYEVW